MDNDDVPSVVAGRYRITGPHQPLLAKATAWGAHDDTLDREVLVLFIDREDPDEVLAAARRAATVTDTRFVKLLDVSRDANLPYIVIEIPRGIALGQVSKNTNSQADADPQLTPDGARAVVGEVASALQVAARSGVRHLDLKPEFVFIENSNVHILGLGFAGALVDQDPLLEADTAARRDVLGLARLLKFTLGPDASDADADGADGADGTAGPALDAHALVISILDNNAGPATPREFAKALQPWQVSAITAAVIPSASEPVAADDSVTSEDAATSEEAVQQGSVAVVRNSIHGGPSRDPLGSSTPGTPPPAIVPRPAASTRIPRPPVVGSAPLDRPAPVRVSSGVGVSAAAGGAGAASVPAVPIVPPGVSVAPPMNASDFFAPRSSPPMSPPPATSSLAASHRAAPSTVPSPRGAVPASGKKSVKNPPSNLKEARESAKRFHFNPTAAILVVVLALVTWGAVSAFSNITSGLVPPMTLVSPKPTTNNVMPATPGADTPTDGTSGAPDAYLPPVIAKGKQLDPDGDGNEHPEAVDRAFDGDLQTAWFSRTYRSADFGGIDKSGIGYAIELEKSTQVSTMYLTTGNKGGKFEIRDTTAKSPSKGTLVASGTFSKDFTITFSKPVVTKNLVLWVTDLPEVNTDGFGLRIYEISLS